MKNDPTQKFKLSLFFAMEIVRDLLFKHFSITKELDSSKAGSSTVDLKGQSSRVGPVISVIGDAFYIFGTNDEREVSGRRVSSSSFLFASLRRVIVVLLPNCNL